MKDKHWPLILKSLMKDISEEENKELSLWLNSDIKNQKALEKAKKAWDRNASIPLDFHPDVASALTKVKSKTGIAAEEKKTVVGHPIQHSKNPFHIIWKVAAGVLVVISVAFITWEVTKKNSAGHTALSETYSATTQKSFIQLMDGSKVWLNKNSTLSCEDGFNQQTRTVHLDGEAFFEVIQNEKKPFIILSTGAKTTVLGTAFNLKAYKAEKNTELIVVHGKVSFANNHADGLILEKGDKGTIHNETGEAIKSINRNVNFMAWKDEKLIFNKTEFEDVSKDIESYFSVKIEIESPAIRTCYFTGTFEKPQLEDVLNDIQITMKINHRQEKDKIILTGNGCN